MIYLNECNNKHILEGRSESEKLVRRLLNYVNDKIKDKNHKNIMSRGDGYNLYKENIISLST